MKSWKKQHKTFQSVTDKKTYCTSGRFVCFAPSSSAQKHTSTLSLWKCKCFKANRRIVFPDKAGAEKIAI